jgi:hypothetical protein
MEFQWSDFSDLSGYPKHGAKFNWLFKHGSLIDIVQREHRGNRHSVGGGIPEWRRQFEHRTGPVVGI